MVLGCATRAMLGLLRCKLWLEYDHWRLSHAALARAAFAFAMGHMLAAGHCSVRLWKHGLWIGWPG